MIAAWWTRVQQCCLAWRSPGSPYQSPLIKDQALLFYWTQSSCPPAPRQCRCEPVPGEGVAAGVGAGGVHTALQCPMGCFVIYLFSQFIILILHFLHMNR